MTINLQDVKIMVDIVHPLFQSKLRIFAVGLCTETQDKEGRSDFLDRMAR